MNTQASFSRASTAFKKDGTTVAANVPRYETGYSGQALMIEEQGGNKFTYSNDLSNAVWTPVNAAAAQNQVDPFGNTNAAWKLVESTANGIHQLKRSASLGIAGNVFTISVFAKAVERSRFTIWNDSAGAGAYFNLLLGTTYNNTADRSSITALGNGWYRCEATFTCLAANIFGLYLITNADQYIYTGDGASGLALFGLQCEQKPFSTSYMPAVGLDGSRDLENVYVPITAANLTLAAGTITARVYIEEKHKLATNSELYIASFSSLTGMPFDLDLIGLGKSTTANTYFARLSNHAGGFADCTITIPLTVGWHRFTMTWDATELVLYVDGVRSSAPVSSPPLPTVMGSKLYLGSFGGVGQFLNTMIDSFQLFSGKASQDEAAAL